MCQEPFCTFCSKEQDKCNSSSSWRLHSTGGGGWDRWEYKIRKAISGQGGDESKMSASGQGLDMMRISGRSCSWREWSKNCDGCLISNPFSFLKSKCYIRSAVGYCHPRPQLKWLPFTGRTKSISLTWPIGPARSGSTCFYPLVSSRLCLSVLPSLQSVLSSVCLHKRYHRWNFPSLCMILWLVSESTTRWGMPWRQGPPLVVLTTVSPFPGTTSGTW